MVAYSFKKRFVRPIKAGLGLIGMGVDGAGNEVPCELVLDPGETKPRPFDPMRDLDPPVIPKRQTIRAIGKRRHARPGETIQLYCGMRTAHCFKIGEARCVSVEPIEIKIREPLGNIRIRVRGDGLHDTDKMRLAKADGFADCCDMWRFWLKEHGITAFKGVLIKWEPLP